MRYIKEIMFWLGILTIAVVSFSDVSLGRYVAIVFAGFGLCVLSAVLEPNKQRKAKPISKVCTIANDEYTLEIWHTDDIIKIFKVYKHINGELHRMHVNSSIDAVINEHFVHLDEFRWAIKQQLK